MDTIHADVTPASAALLVIHWQTTPVWQKLAYVNELNATLNLLATSDLRRRSPTESEVQLQRRPPARWLGAKRADQVVGPIVADGHAPHEGAVCWRCGATHQHGSPHLPRIRSSGGARCDDRRTCSESSDYAAVDHGSAGQDGRACRSAHALRLV